MYGDFSKDQLTDEARPEPCICKLLKRFDQCKTVRKKLPLGDPSLPTAPSWFQCFQNGNACSIFLCFYQGIR